MPEATSAGFGEIGTDVEIEFMNGNYKSAKVCLVSDK